MAKNIDKDIADLWLRSSLRNAQDENFKDATNRVARGLEGVPSREMIMQAQYIDEVLLPRIEKQRGAGSDYKFFRAVYKSLVWAVCLVDRNEYQELRHAKDSLLLEFYADHAQKLERHLNKYAAMEDFFLTGAMDKVGEGIAERAREAIAQKKSWK